MTKDPTLEDGKGKLAAIGELDIPWITAGLGSHGDTIAMTAATQPSIEDVARRKALDSESLSAQLLFIDRQR